MMALRLVLCFCVTEFGCGHELLPGRRFGVLLNDDCLQSGVRTVPDGVVGRMQSHIVEQRDQLRALPT